MSNTKNRYIAGGLYATAALAYFIYLLITYGSLNLNNYGILMAGAYILIAVGCFTSNPVLIMAGAGLRILHILLVIINNLRATGGVPMPLFIALNVFLIGAYVLLLLACLKPIAGAVYGYIAAGAIGIALILAFANSHWHLSAYSIIVYLLQTAGVVFCGKYICGISGGAQPENNQAREYPPYNTVYGQNTAYNDNNSYRQNNGYAANNAVNPGNVYGVNGAYNQNIPNNNAYGATNAYQSGLTNDEQVRAEKLRQLYSLLERGVITQEQYEEKKNEILK